VRHLSVKLEKFSHFVWAELDEPIYGPIVLIDGLPFCLSVELYREYLILRLKCELKAGHPPPNNKANKNSRSARLRFHIKSACDPSADIVDSSASVLLRISENTSKKILVKVVGVVVI
jgi:hypothetical protein